MGIIKVLLYSISTIGTGLYISLRLGRNLEISSRQTGRTLGLFYIYVKVILLNLKPKTQEPGEIVKMIRNINQQSHAFSRELSSNILNTKQSLSQHIPALKSNFLEKKKKEFDSLISTQVNKLKEKNLLNEELLNLEFNNEKKPSKLNESSDINNQNVLLNKKEKCGSDILESCLIERRNILIKKSEKLKTNKYLYDNIKL